MRSDTSAQTGFSRDSQALLLRARLGLRTGSLWDTATWRHFTALIELADYAAANFPATHSSRSVWLAVDYVL